jgi:hypothetical protein
MLYDFVGGGKGNISVGRFNAAFDTLLKMAVSAGECSGLQSDLIS